MVYSPYEQQIWFSIKNWCSNEYGIAGLMGNLYAESGLIFGRCENDFTADYSPSQVYTQKLNSGQVTRDQFRYNSVPPQTSGYGPGYGLAQWTFYTRKYAYWDYYNEGSHGQAGSDTFELWFLEAEITGLLTEYNYLSVYSAMQSATTVRQASDVVLVQFENPYDQSEAVKILRASYGQALYDEYAGSDPPPPPPPQTIPVWLMWYFTHRTGQHGRIKPRTAGRKDVIF